MPTIEETATGATPLAGALAAGVGNISYAQSVTFARYIRIVLPLDGYVFWCRAAIVIPGSALYNQALYNTTRYNQGGTINRHATELVAQGSLHYSTVENQEEASSGSTNSVIFTSLTEVNDLNDIDPNEMWIAEFNGIRFAFSQRVKFYEQSGLYHYRGDALYTDMETQLIDSSSQLDFSQAVVSNSLPIWLSLNALVPVYPSFAVPMNLPPPYAAVHVDPGATKALQAFPLIDLTGSHWQLATDRVKFTLYGVPNNLALDFQDYILNAALPDDGPFGLMSMPIMQDERENQKEFQILAQKKTFSLDISYYQARVQEIARQLILSAFIDITISDFAVNV